MKDMVEKAENLELTPYEIKAYTALVGVSEATAPWISKNSDVPMSKIYEVLRRLSKKGLVISSPDSNPRRYKAVDPSTAINALAEEKEGRIEEARTYLLKDLEKRVSEAEDTGIWVVEGRKTVNSVIDSLLGEAERNVVCNHIEDEELPERLEELEERGITVSSEETATAPNMLNVDGREVLVYGDRWEALWIRDPKYCKTGTGPG